MSVGVFDAAQDAGQHRDEVVAPVLRFWNVFELENLERLGGPSQFESMFVSLAHSDDDIDRTVEAAGELLGGR